MDEKTRKIPGIELVRNYPKAKGAELYGGLRFHYRPEEHDGLPVARFCEALAAEGVPAAPYGFHQPEHLRAIFTQDLPGLWGKGHCGPADVPLPRYRKGDYPLSEAVRERVFSLPGWIEAADGAVDQVSAAIAKVAEGHERLLEAATT